MNSAPEMTFKFDIYDEHNKIDKFNFHLHIDAKKKGI